MKFQYESQENEDFNVQGLFVLDESKLIVKSKAGKRPCQRIARASQA